jgi:hypothetical protein
MTGTLTERLTNDWAAGTTCGVLFPTYLAQWAGYGERLPMESQPRAALWVELRLPLPDEDISCRSTEIGFLHRPKAFVPRTALGRKLIALRTRAIKEGMRLLSADEILEEVKRRRGELGGDEADVY